MLTDNFFQGRPFESDPSTREAVAQLLASMRATFASLAEELKALSAAIAEGLKASQEILKPPAGLFDGARLSLGFPDFASFKLDVTKFDPELLEFWEDIWMVGFFDAAREWPNYTEERSNALIRLSHRLKPKLGKPRARRALKILAEQRERSPRDLLANWLFPAGFELSLHEDSLNRPVRRIGKFWIKGNVLPDQLPLRDFRAWVIQEVYKNATLSVLECIFDSGAREQKIDFAVLSYEETVIEAAKTHARKDRAIALKLAGTPTERKVMKLLEIGADQKKILKLCKSPENLRQIISRIRKKAAQI